MVLALKGNQLPHLAPSPDKSVLTNRVEIDSMEERMTERGRCRTDALTKNSGVQNCSFDDMIVDPLASGRLKRVYRRLSQAHLVPAFALLVFSCLVLGVPVEADETVAKESTPPGTPKQTMVKEWYLEKIHLAGIELPFDYVTLVVCVVSIFVLYNGLFREDPNKPKCTASHILIPGSDDSIKAQMEDWKKKIGDDQELFAKYALEHSTCPSKAKGGLLGTFPKGAMVPPFDKACFDPSTPIKTTVGPVQTHFGFHLIYIHDRKLPVVKK